MPYAAAPSWLSALAHPGAHRRASVALLRAVHARWSQIPAEVRPRLVVLGESLGANGMAAALRRLPQVLDDVDGGLLVGGVRSAWWEPLGRVSLVRHDDDPVVRLGLRTAHLLPSAGGAPEGHGHRYGAAELEVAWRTNLAGGLEASAAGAMVPGDGGRARDRADGGVGGRGDGTAGGGADSQALGRGDGGADSQALGRGDGVANGLADGGANGLADGGTDGLALGGANGLADGGTESLAFGREDRGATGMADDGVGDGASGLALGRGDLALAGRGG